MGQLPTLIRDLAIILAAAGVTSLLFRKLKQPVVLGYIVVGLLVGPNFHLFPTIGDMHGVETWANIGVIFLLFSLGLEFSFKKLLKSGGASAITGLFETGCMMVLGFFIGKMLNWPLMDCLFLGGIIAISSTTIIIKAFDELKVKNSSFAGKVLGILIIEDLVAVLLLVLLSTLAVSREFEGSQLLFSIVKLLFFLCLWLVTGIFLIPTFLKRASKLMSDETLLIVSLGLCLFMVILATQVGFSSALGAFLMGSILAETVQAEKIEKLIHPIKNLFGAIFFVSVGMLIDPKLLFQYIGPVLIITLVVLCGKTLFVTIGSLLSGQPLKQSVQAGFSLSQIGEFSFIIATLGLTLKVTSSYLYPIAVGVSVITTFTTPYMIKLSGPCYNWLEKHLPKKWSERITQYSSGAQTIEGESQWKKVLRSYITLIVIHTVIIAAIILLVSRLLGPFIAARIENPLLASIINVIIGIILIAPFAWALTAKKMHGVGYSELWLDKKYNRGPLLMLEILRSIITVLLVGFLFNQFFSFGVSILLAIAVLTIVLLIFNRRLQAFYQRIERRFMTNLNDRQNIQYASNSGDLSPWDAHLAYFEVSPLLPCVGRSLLDLAWREKYGVNIASIERGGVLIRTPNAHDAIYPYDKLAVIGTDAQLLQFKEVIETPVENETGTVSQNDDEMVLHAVIADSHNHLPEQSIRSSRIREKTNGLVAGVERNGERILNPPSDFVFKWDDVIWIVGDYRKIIALSKEDKAKIQK